MCAFLGLAHYLSAFLPSLASHTAILDPLTSSEFKSCFPAWTIEHQAAFDAIKKLVTSADCLTFIDHENPGENKIFVTTDASNIATGAVLSYGPSWESARPVAFDSKSLNPAEKCYPVHDKEMLAIVWALKRWCSDLLGMPFFIYTDHKTLEFFNTQKEILQRQARWMELLCQYDSRIVYVKGDENVAADALSRTLFVEDSCTAQERAHFLLGPSDDDNDFAVCLICASSTDQYLGAVSIASVEEEATAVFSAAATKPRLRKLAAGIDKSFLDTIGQGYSTDP